MNAIYINDTKGLHSIPYSATTQRYNSPGIAVMVTASTNLTRVVRLVFKHGYFMDITMDDTVKGKYIADSDLYQRDFRFGYYISSKFEIPYLHRQDAKNQILRSCSDDLKVTPELRRSFWHYYLFHRKIQIPDSLAASLRILCLSSGFNLKWCGSNVYRITRSFPKISKVKSIQPLSILSQPIHISTIHADDSICTVGYQGLLIN